MLKKLGIGLGAAFLVTFSALPAEAQTSDRNRFHKAVKERDAEAVRGFLTSGSIIINTKGGSGESVLHILVRDRDHQWLRYLLSSGARTDIHDRDGNSPLGLAAQIGWAEGAELLLIAGANPNAANRRGETPLILAVQRRDPALVRLLVGKGADPKRADIIAGLSALEYARRDVRSQSLVRLMEEGGIATPTEEEAPKLSLIPQASDPDR